MRMYCAGPVVAVTLLGLVSPAVAATWNCYSIGDIENATRNYASGDDIVIYPGTYYEQAVLQLNRGAVTFRGSTGNRDDVIIQGPGQNNNTMPTESIIVISDNVTIRDLTIRGFYTNGIHIRGENDADAMTVRNVKILDCGERYIKGSTNTGSSTSISDNVLIEDVWMEQLTPMAGHADNNYVGGIDAMGINAWTIRRVTAKNIKGATGGGRGGIFLWNGATNCVVERNTVYGGDTGIAMGNPAAPGHAYLPGLHVSGGIVRNNMVTRGAYIGLELCFTSNLKVYHNSVYSADADYFRTVHVYDSAGQTNNLQIHYCVVRGQLFDNASGSFTTTGSIIGTAPQSTWFVDYTTANLHLASAATSCFDGAPQLADVTGDFDGETRPFRPDIGADESFIAFKQDSGADGILCIDVENCHSYLNQGGDSWSLVTSPTGYAGVGALQSLPNDGTNRNADYLTMAPRMNFWVKFNKTGTHYVWVRGYAASGSDDSCHAGLDNGAVSTADRIDGFGTGAYRWTKHTIDGTDATMSIPSAVERQLNLWMREDGLVIDRVLLTTNASYTPSGAGPAQSPR